MTDQKLIIFFIEIGRPVIFNHFIFESYTFKSEIIDQLLLIIGAVVVIPCECYVIRHIPAAGCLCYSVILRSVLYVETHLITSLSLIPDYITVMPKTAVTH